MPILPSPGSKTQGHHGRRENFSVGESSTLNSSEANESKLMEKITGGENYSKTSRLIEVYLTFLEIK